MANTIDTTNTATVATSMLNTILASAKGFKPSVGRPAVNVKSKLPTTIEPIVVKPIRLGSVDLSTMPVQAPKVTKTENNKTETGNVRILCKEINALHEKTVKGLAILLANSELCKTGLNAFNLGSSTLSDLYEASLNQALLISRFASREIGFAELAEYMQLKSTLNGDEWEVCRIKDFSNAGKPAFCPATSAMQSKGMRLLGLVEALTLETALPKSPVYGALNDDIAQAISSMTTAQKNYLLGQVATLPKVALSLASLDWTRGAAKQSEAPSEVSESEASEASEASETQSEASEAPSEVQSEVQSEAKKSKKSKQGK